MKFLPPTTAITGYTMVTENHHYCQLTRNSYYITYQMLMFIAAYNAYNIVIMPAQTKPQMLDSGLNNFITWVRCAQCLHECINTDVDIKVLVLKLCKFYGGY